MCIYIYIHMYMYTPRLQDLPLLIMKAPILKYLVYPKPNVGP